jgi:hypothetical protein
LAGVFDGTNVEYLYVDGQLVAESTDATASPSVTGEDLWIGGDPDPGLSQFFDGMMDEVAIFTNALAPNQLLWLYSTASNEPFLNTPEYAPSSATVTLTWSTVPSLSYQLQNTTNLGQNQWSILFTNLTATNTTMTLRMASSGGPEHFYRILVMP